MAYCRLTADCDLYLYHDGERFVFTGPAGDSTCDRAEEALSTCVLLLQRGYKVAFGAIARLADEILAAVHTPGLPDQGTPRLSTAAMTGTKPSTLFVEDGPTVIGDEDLCHDDETPLDDQAWHKLASRLAMGHGAEPRVLSRVAQPGEALGAERLEACLQHDLLALPAALDGTGDPQFVQTLVGWAHDLDALNLELVCVQRPGTMFALTPESRSRLEQQALIALSLDVPSLGVERSRL